MEMLSVFYQNRVLSLDIDNIDLVVFPFMSKETKIEQDFFSWRLYSGKKYIECRSENVAKFLQIYYDAHQRCIAVPKDEKYLKEIMPILLHLKEGHDEEIEEGIETLLVQRQRDKATSIIWSKIFSDRFIDTKAMEKIHNKLEGFEDYDDDEQDDDFEENEDTDNENNNDDSNNDNEDENIDGEYDYDDEDEEENDYYDEETDDDYKDSSKEKKDVKQLRLFNYSEINEYDEDEDDYDEDEDDEDDEDEDDEDENDKDIENKAEISEGA